MSTKMLPWFSKVLFIPVAVLLITILLSMEAAGVSGVCYVKANASGANNGASWTDAYTDLQSALGASPCSEVWVAAGTYKPTSGTDRAISFVLKNGVALYGGFAGTETDRGQRDPLAHVTILSGGIGASNIYDNSYHIVNGGGTDDTAVLDGFTVTGGYASDSSASGGGIYNNSSSPTLTNLTFDGNWAISYDIENMGIGYGGGMYNSNSNPTLMNVTFKDNWATSGSGGGNGGGMYNNRSSPTLTNVTFSGNSASDSGSSTYGGGGMYNNRSSPTLTNVTFSSNSAGYGGGIYNDNSSPTLTSVTFNNNSGSSVNGGGGIFNYNSSSPTLTNVTFTGNHAYAGGGVSNWNNSSPILTNVTFTNNYADHGGGIDNYNGSSPTLTNVTFSDNHAHAGGGMSNNSSSPTLTNVTFSGNYADGGTGGGIYNINLSSNPQIRNSIFWGDSAGIEAEIYNSNSSLALADSVVAGGCPSGATCTNIITSDPLLGPLANNGGFTQTRALGAGSSAVDAGNDATCASVDQRGVARPQGLHCDMGAYEYVEPPTPTPTETPTQTLTPTPTETPTSTPTPTPTETSDGTLPTIDSFSINAGALSSTSVNVTLLISASDPTNGVDQMSFSNNGTAWSDWQAYTTLADWSLSAGDGSKTVYARVMDTSGNISSTVFDTISLDTTVGIEFSVTINAGALFTNQTAVTLTLSARPGTAQMQVSNDGGFAGALWKPYSSQKAWAITQYGSYVIPRVVYVRYKDINGNTSGTVQDDIILDVTPPEGGFQIVTGSSSTLKAKDPKPHTEAGGLICNEQCVSDVDFLQIPGSGLSGRPLGSVFAIWLASQRFPSTTSLTQTYAVYLPLVIKSCSGCIKVTLLLSATDDASGVGQMMISNQSDFAGAQWQPYTTQKDWSVSGTGTTTVYVKFRDNASNVSIVYSHIFSP